MSRKNTLSIVLIIVINSSSVVFANSSMEICNGTIYQNVSVQPKGVFRDTWLPIERDKCIVALGERLPSIKWRLPSGNVYKTYIRSRTEPYIGALENNAAFHTRFVILSAGDYVLGSIEHDKSILMFSDSEKRIIQANRNIYTGPNARLKPSFVCRVYDLNNDKCPLGHVNWKEIHKSF